MVTAKGECCACRRRENHCPPSVPPERGSEVWLLPHPRFPTVRVTWRVSRRDHHKGEDEVGKRRGEGVRHTEKRQVHSYQEKKKEWESKPIDSFYSHRSAQTAVPCRLAERHRGVKVTLLKLSLWIFMLLFYLAKSWMVLHGLTSLLWLSQTQIPMPPKGRKDTRNCSREQERGGKTCRKTPASDL